MCLLLIGWRAHPAFPLIVAANRDESYARPADPLAPWPEASGVVAGRDRRAGGTWMGIHGPRGRFAAVTSYRSPADIAQSRPASRGRLVADFLVHDVSPDAFTAAAQRRAGDFGGFNLIVAAGDRMRYVGNRSGRPAQDVAPGVVGLSNALLDTPWPKVTTGKRRMAEILRGDDAGEICDRLLDLLADGGVAPDEQLPDTGVGRTWERALSPLFVAAPDYGTRCSSVVIVDARGAGTFVERRFAPAAYAGETRIDFQWRRP